ncbi:primosomal protein N' [Bailinhaonella thermotolerans]|uniref:Probable replication restart protein PriA n=1 Tax=Bailinhaonella thermotolerans TaxID=1070861 RepID=A0A3A4BAW7_9ACTN|nr:primosomal protein N' [Bailinhaonella thermotolerans]RJL31348.1 primosomal protein N' [Bailinhaonella thermotolerans]
MSEPTSQPGAQEALLAVPEGGRAKGAAREGRVAGGRAARAGGPGGEVAAELPVARVVVDTQLPHLDRPFDYLVPASLAEAAVPGCRVRVRFAGKLVDGFLLERAAESGHDGRLARLERVISPEPVLTPEIAALAREVADRYAGTLADVLRLAVPPRHARVEAEAARAAAQAAGPVRPEAAAGDAVPGERPGGGARPGGDPGPAQEEDGERGPEPGADAARAEDVAPPGPGPWAEYPAGASFLRALAEGRGPRAVWTALPGGWAEAVAVAVRATLAGGRGAVVVVPDGRDVALVDEALRGTGHVALTADLGPAERYRRWLKVLRGQARAVVGTRAAMFAPVRDLGLAVIWDDGDDLHAEPHAPYPHAREVLGLRAHRAGAGMLVGGHARTAEGTQLVASGWAHAITPDRSRLRARAPRVVPLGDDAELARDGAARAARLPTMAWRALKSGLEKGPVLVQVPRRGYLPALACRRCRAAARCAHCRGPLALRGGHAAPYCRWCGRIEGAFRCPSCGGHHVRAVVVGARRTAEELGRAFPSTKVRTSGRDAVVDRVGPEPALIVATPGAEPVAEGGYAACVLLDGWALLGRPDLRVNEEALRRWLNAGALARPGAPLVVLADGALPVVQALLRWDPVTHAERELADRAELGFPPAVRMATLTGSPEGVRDLLTEVRLPPEAQVLGPVPVGEAGQERALVRVPRSAGTALARALKGASGVRSARKAPEVVRVRIDPLDLI